MGYGAVLNVKDVYGDTPLHDVLAKMAPLTIRHSDDIPQLNKVRAVIVRLWLFHMYLCEVEDVLARLPHLFVTFVTCIW